MKETLESIPNGMVLVDATGTIRIANSELERMFGYDVDELLGQPIEVLVPERYRSGHPELRSSFFANPEFRRMGAGRELFGTKKDGSEFPVEVGLSPIAFEGATGVLAAIIDITERQRLQRESVYLASIVEGSDDAIIGKSLDGTIVSWNRGAEQLYGYSREEVVGRSIELLLPPDRGGEVQDILKRLRAGQVVDHFETVRQRKDGTCVEISLTVSPMFDPNGTVIGASAIARDITERRHIEQRFKSAVEAAPSGMVMINRDGRIVMVNGELESIFGYARDELLGQLIELLIPMRFRSEHPEKRTVFFQNPESRRMGAGRDLYGIRKDGSEISVEVALNPLSTPEGDFVLAAVVDITERKHIEQELANRSNDLETLLHITSHDLQEPLRTIQLFSRLIVDRYSDGVSGKAQDFLTRIASAGDRMEGLIKDVLMLSRAQRMEQPASPVPGAKLVGEALEPLRQRAAQLGASISVQSDLPTLIVNPVWAIQALQNLIGNALKFCEVGQAPEIEIDSYTDVNGVCGLVVRDRGIGIDPAHSERVFTLFQRAVSRSIDGTGAGLAIVRQVAERHGGRAWAQPREGGGSEFFITFGRNPQLEHIT